MEQKTISINPNLFSFNKSSSDKSKKRSLPLKIQKPSTLKKELIKKIRNYQNKTKKKKSYPIDNDFNSEFKESLEYLRNVMEEKNMDKKNEVSYTDNSRVSDISTSYTQEEPYLRHQPYSQHSQLPRQSQDQQQSQPKLEIPIYESNSGASVKTNDDVPWGVLKNGKKPTYRTWIREKTLKQPKLDINSQQIDIYAKNNQLLTLNNDTMHNITNKTNINIPKQPRKLKKKTIKRKYTCGKSKSKKQIGIIIKGIETKNKVLKEQRDLRKESMQTIRNYLYKKSFIKVGSSAPDKVLRDMYESIILTGDVNNINSHILIHNYMNEN